VLDPNASHEAKVVAIKKHYNQSTLDPEVTSETLGSAHTKVTPETLLSAAKKILDVHAGKAQVDDTDSLKFKTFHALDDFISERIRLSSRQWIPKAKLALTNKNIIRDALKPAPFSDAIRKFVTTSSLSSVPMGINPMEIIDHAVKVTSLGEGGIPSDRAIPLDARMIHNTHFGALDPIRTPESNHSGVDIRATIAAHRDDKGNLYTVLRNVKTGKEEFIRAGDLHKYVVAFPHQELKGTVDAFVNGKQIRVPASQVTHQLDHVKYMYSPATTLIPLIHSIQGNRAIMGSKMGTQALPLVEREAPLVQVKSHHPDGHSFETIYGHMIVPTAPVSGTVAKIDNQFIYIKPHAEKRAAAGDTGLIKVPYYQKFPFPSKTFLDHAVSVKPGDKVEEGQRLAESNYTRNGVLALGKNLLVGYLPYYGYNSNDAVVISESAARKLTSEHMYREVFPISTGTELNRAKHQLYYGAKYPASMYSKLDESGVVKKGTKVNPKDLLVAGLMKQSVTGTDAILGRLSKSLVKPFKDIALTWEHSVPGEIVDVVRSNKQITILVKTLEPMQIGDKLAGRYGNKGVVAKIVPDHEMLRDEQGRPLDLLMTSAGVVSRINPAQIIETAVSKVAEKTGKPIVYDNAAGHDAVKWARNLLNKHGIKDKEVLYDPVLNRKIVGPDGKGVLVGKQYIYKLFKSTDTNFSGHGVGPYDINEQPLKTGGDESAKSIGKMEFDALLAHNARSFLREAATVRGQKNDEYWKAVQMGLPLPEPKPSFAFNKFIGMLEGAGVKVDKRGSKFTLLPMTDKDVLTRSSGAIENNTTVRAKDLKPMPGGLFDPRKTGGLQGTLFSHIDLHEPIPNPVFEEPVRRLLGMTETQFRTALRTNGGAWFRHELSKIDVPRKLRELREQLKTAKGAALDDVVKQIKYLEALQKHNLNPADAYVISKVPVIPPVFRPILPSVHDPSQLMVSDVNKLYSQLLDSNKTLKTTAVPSDLGKHRLDLYEKVEELYGIALPRDPKLQQQKVKGLLANISGVGTPKGGFFQRKLMRHTQDVSGRGTAVPDSNLSMDEVGIPEDMLWQALDKLIVARLIRTGYPALQARELVNERAPAARNALLEEIRERPVLINRAPTLHRGSIIAAYAKPVPGKTIRVSSFAEKGMNLDYDGDTLQVHFPIGPEAVQEAKQMTLSNLLLSDQQRNKLMVFPQHEAIIAFTLASKHTIPTGPVRKFKTREDALAAYRRGELKLSDAIEIENETEKRADNYSEGPHLTAPVYSISPDEALFYFPPELLTGVNN
jgi:DNA-directed RNA polymerase beta subunit